MGLEDVSKYPALFAALLGTGTWSLDDLKKGAGLNFLRVFREVEKVGPFFVKNPFYSVEQHKFIRKTAHNLDKFCFQTKSGQYSICHGRNIVFEMNRNAGISLLLKEGA